MEAQQDERIRRARAHFAAARQLQAGMRKYPETRRSLLACVRHHIGEAANLAQEFCGKKAAAGQPEPGAALPVTAKYAGWRAPRR